MFGRSDVKRESFRYSFQFYRCTTEVENHGARQSRAFGISDSRELALDQVSLKSAEGYIMLADGRLSLRR